MITYDSEIDKGFGVVYFAGKEYILLRDATLSNRVFSGWFGDAADGEEYISEWTAPAVDRDGNEYTVSWHFNVVKGEEPEDGSYYDWYDVTDVY